MIDALGARSNAARASALVALRGALQRRPVAAVLSNHRATLADHVSKALRRGKDGEKKAAAAIAPLLALQVSVLFYNYSSWLLQPTLRYRMKKNVTGGEPRSHYDE